MNTFSLPLLVTYSALARPMLLLLFMVLLWRSANYRAKKQQNLLDKLDDDIQDGPEAYWKSEIKGNDQVDLSEDNSKAE